MKWTLANDEDPVQTSQGAAFDLTLHVTYKTNGGFLIKIKIIKL